MRLSTIILALIKKDLDKLIGLINYILTVNYIANALKILYI